MKVKEQDPIMAEMHAIKDAHSARFGHDIDRIFADLGQSHTAPGAQSTRPIQRRAVKRPSKRLSVAGK